MICRRALCGRILRKSCCRKGGLSIQQVIITGNPSKLFSTISIPNTLSMPGNFIFNDFPTEKTLKTDCSEINAILERMKITEYGSLMAELVAATKEVKTRVLDQRLVELMEEDFMSYNYLAEAQKSAIHLRQLCLEEDQQNDAVNNYNESLKELITMGRGTGLKYVQRVLLKWYEPLTQVLDAEISLIEQRVNAQDRTQYGPCMLLLPADKLAVITLDECLNSILKVGNSGVQLTSLSRRIGDVIEAEVAIMKLQKGKSGLRPWQSEALKKMYNESNFRKTRQKLNQLVDDDVWTNDVKVKVGAALVSFLLDSAKTSNGTPAFQYSKRIVQKGCYKKAGILKLDNSQYLEISGKDTNSVAPRYLPMLVPPRIWDNKKQKEGCYYRLRSTIMRTSSKAQTDALRRANMNGVLVGLDYLGQVGWRINVPILETIKAAYNMKLVFGDLPGKEIQPPTEAECVRIIPKRVYKTVYVFKPKIDPDAAQEDLDEDDGEVPWDHPIAREDIKPASKGKRAVEEFDPDVPRFDEKYYSEMCRRTAVKNASLHSLRCDLELKFWVAEKFKDETFFYPYNLDFRGRAYPVPPNLNHLGSDLCRSLLLFDEERPLGEIGLFWMKVHLSNLFGNNKISHHDRVAFVDKNLDHVFAAAASPLGDDRWWTEAEEPFQALATCIEIAAAINSGNPATYMCRLPVHQDGSCNGLQHYAALGRDAIGASAVNVRPSDKPQDVYTSVLDIVRLKIAVDVKQEETCSEDADKLRGVHARLVQDVVDRRVIKQTVMTSVYGVTKVGARAQIQARLHEKLMIDPSKITTPEMETELFGASTYLANLTLESLAEMFTSAKDIMDWLGTCASLVASQGQAMAWVTPLGLPVMQPYRKTSTHTVRTILQSITLSLDDDALPVSKQKQRTAFPPNFVHSLDATHMLMTTLKMKEKGIVFAAVHDSYWTHAGDIPEMNVAIRDCFFDLYNEPILETLRESLTIRYPDVTFPPVPERGTLDLRQVKLSTYFFH